MTAGPNSITNEFSDIWRAFIPFSQYQVFQHGGYYATEVIPGQVAAISLNTMFWYDSNKGQLRLTPPYIRLEAKTER
jgi:endopolyphosphatase